MSFVLDEKGNYLPVFGESSDSDTTNHAQLTNLDYDSSGHTGFLKEDASNLTTSGKATVARASMPAATYETLDFPETAQGVEDRSYTKTKAGYYNVSCISAATGAFIYLNNVTTGLATQSVSPNGTGMNCYLPADANQQVHVGIYAANSISVKFFPLVGEQ